MPDDLNLREFRETGIGYSQVPGTEGVSRRFLGNIEFGV
jgi:hypothetical protein